MRPLLLDTHAFFWAVRDADLLSPRARAAISDPGNDVLVSAVTAYELAQKYRLGRMPEAADVVAGYEGITVEMGAIALSVHEHHALAAGLLEWENRDPFDRILVAQARIAGATLVTRDRAMSTAPGVTLLW